MNNVTIQLIWHSLCIEKCMRVPKAGIVKIIIKISA